MFVSRSFRFEIRPSPRARRTAAALLPLAMSLAPQWARAADADTSLPPVVVTAERVPGTVDKAPVSVAVVSQEDIDKKGLYQLSDLVGIVAGMSVPNGYSNMPQTVGLRGMGVSQAAMAQAVGIYVDDVPLQRGYATALWDLPDVVRYEVLRGPQGTLYGQNSTVGAVKLVSADPDEIAGSWASVGLGNLGQREVRGLFAGKLTSDLSASLAISSRANDGFAYNATLHKDINKLDATQFRAKAKVLAGPSAHITFAVDGLLDRSDTNTVNFPVNHENAAPRVSFNSSDAGAFKRKAGGASVTAEWDVTPSTRLRSITAYRGYTDDPTVVDWSGTEVERYELTQQVRQRTLSQELQLVWRGGALDLVAGLMLVRDHFYFNRHVLAFPLAAPAPGYTLAFTNQATQDEGLYAQGHLRLTERLAVTLGLRSYRTRQQASNAFWRTNAAFVPTQQVYNAPDLHTSAHGVLPRLGLDFNVSDTTFAYASIARGEKFAGFNRAAESLISASVAARPEKVTTYETGVKLHFGPERLNLSAAAFYNDGKDYLSSVAGTTINGVLVTDQVFVNAASVRSYGLDLEGEKGLTSAASLTGSFEWLNAKFRSYINPSGAATTDYAGHDLAYAPHWSAAIGLRARTRLAGGLLTGDAWLQLIDRQFTDAGNTPSLSLPRQTYGNFALTYAPDGARWQASLRVRNATDRAYVLNRARIPALGIDTAYYNAPRTVMASLRHEL